MSKNKKNQEKKEDVNDLDLSQVHFPSLGGKETLKPMPTKIEGTAYAMAVLKPTTIKKQPEKEQMNKERTETKKKKETK
jgi:hypothetical protein